MKLADESQSSGWHLEIEAPFTIGSSPEPKPAAVPTPPRPTSEAPPPLHRLVEAMLFVGGAPLAVARAAEVIRGLNADQLGEAVNFLNASYRRQGRPYLIEQRCDAYLLTLRPAYRFVHEKLQGGIREARLSVAAIEVLSIIAYRQPATKQQIDTLRGHESGHLIRQLIRRGLIAILERPTPGDPVRFATTKRFLEFFGLGSLDDLPQTEDLQRI